MHFELKYTFDAPVDVVIEALIDPSFPDFMKRHMKMMTDIKAVSRKEEGEKLVWTWRCVPVPMIKKIGPKEIPPELFPFIQESTLDRASKTITFKNLGEHPRVRKHLENSGEFHFREVGGKTEQTIRGELRITNLPFLLKPLALLAEQVIYSNAQNLLNEEAQVFSQFLKERNVVASAG